MSAQYWGCRQGCWLGVLGSLRYRSLRGSLNCYADQGADGVDDGIFGFEGMAVSDDFSDFMDYTDHSDEGGDLHCLPFWPAEAEGERNQCIGGEVSDPVHGAGKGVAGSWYAADSEEAKRQQHGGCAGKSGESGKGCCVQGNVL